VVVIAVTVIWAFVGRLPEKVDISGLYTSNAQVQSIYAPANGKIESGRSARSHGRQRNAKFLRQD
jgi:hypothetical protein